jgi:Mn2+/Fe2+ NRAMP family transporter
MRRIVRYIAILGPGLAIAATGVGAGDLVAGAAAGARYGLAVAWAAIAGAVLKFALNEGLARWHLATDTTLLEGWARYLGRAVRVTFLAYLVLWSFVVGGALISACGLAAHALVPALSLEVWGVMHAVVAAVIVLRGGYRSFERLVKVFIAVMFVALVGCAVAISTPHTVRDTVVHAAIPRGGLADVLAVIGGVGGSVTLLSYGYWIRERGWRGPEAMKFVRVDLAVAYVLTGLFGLAVIVLAAGTLLPAGIQVAGRDGVLDMAAMLGAVLGPAGYWLFLVGFWGAVATSMLGVWQGVPYLFCDFVTHIGKRRDRDEPVSPRSPWYRGFLAWLAIPPIAVLYFGQPVLVVRVYAALGALFMPFLAITLLILGNRREVVGRLRNGSLSNVLLGACVALFAALAIRQFAGWFAP